MGQVRDIWAIIWDQINGPRELRQVLIEEHGFSRLPQLAEVNGISDDATTISGSYLKRGRIGGFVVKLDRPIVVTSGVLGDFNGNSELDVGDLDLSAAEMQSGRNVDLFDVNDDSIVDFEDRRVWVNNLANTYFGDSNLDGEFNSTDLAEVFEAGQYEDAMQLNSTWATGDWNGDGDFTSSDLVLAFREGGYEQGPRQGTKAVPEPTSVLAITLVLTAIARCQRLWRHSGDQPSSGGERPA